VSWLAVAVSSLLVPRSSLDAGGGHAVPFSSMLPTVALCFAHALVSRAAAPPLRRRRKVRLSFVACVRPG